MAKGQVYILLGVVAVVIIGILLFHIMKYAKMPDIKEYLKLGEIKTARSDKWGTVKDCEETLEAETGIEDFPCTSTAVAGFIARAIRNDFVLYGDKFKARGEFLSEDNPRRLIATGSFYFRDNGKGEYYKYEDLTERQKKLLRWMFFDYPIGKQFRPCKSEKVDEECVTQILAGMTICAGESPGCPSLCGSWIGGDGKLYSFGNEQCGSVDCLGQDWETCTATKCSSLCHVDSPYSVERNRIGKFVTINISEDFYSDFGGNGVQNILERIKLKKAIRVGKEPASYSYLPTNLSFSPVTSTPKFWSSEEFNFKTSGKYLWALYWNTENEQYEVEITRMPLSTSLELIMAYGLPLDSAEELASAVNEIFFKFDENEQDNEYNLGYEKKNTFYYGKLNRYGKKPPIYEGLANRHFEAGLVKPEFRIKAYVTFNVSKEISLTEFVNALRDYFPPKGKCIRKDGSVCEEENTGNVKTNEHAWEIQVENCYNENDCLSTNVEQRLNRIELVDEDAEYYRIWGDYEKYERTDEADYSPIENYYMKVPNFFKKIVIRTTLDRIKGKFRPGRQYKMAIFRYRTDMKKKEIPHDESCLNPAGPVWNRRTGEAGCYNLFQKQGYEWDCANVKCAWQYVRRREKICFNRYYFYANYDWTIVIWG